MKALSSSITSVSTGVPAETRTAAYDWSAPAGNSISSAAPSCRNCHRRPSPSPVSIQKDTFEAFGAARFRLG
jgi:hypothetical protein